MATTPNLGIIKLESNLRQPEVPINTALDVIDAMFHRCSVYHNANQSVPNAAYTVLAFNSERIDTELMHDNSTNNSRITINTAGDYVASALVAFAAHAAGTRGIEIRLNGSTVLAAAQMEAVSEASTGTILSLVMPPYTFAENDYLQVLAFQSSGGALNALAAASYSPNFGVWRVG
jgi:hypothetical protein